jgi:hypothetical protein
LDVERENLLAKLEHLKGQVLKLRKRWRSLVASLCWFGNPSMWNGVVNSCVQRTSWSLELSLWWNCTAQDLLLFKDSQL